MGSASSPREAQAPCSCAQPRVTVRRHLQWKGTSRWPTSGSSCLGCLSSIRLEDALRRRASRARKIRTARTEKKRRRRRARATERRRIKKGNEKKKRSVKRRKRRNARRRRKRRRRRRRRRSAKRRDWRRRARRIK